MARRVLDRRKLRAESESAEALGVKATPATKTRKAKVKDQADGTAVPKEKKARVKKTKLPPRMRVRWCIYDAAMKPVAMFDYNQRPAAQARLAEYLEKKPNYFLQLHKELLPIPEDALGAS